MLPMPSGMQIPSGIDGCAAHREHGVPMLSGEHCGTIQGAVTQSSSMTGHGGPPVLDELASLDPLTDAAVVEV